MAEKKQEFMTITSLFNGVIIHTPYTIQPLETVEVEKEVAEHLIKKGLAKELVVNRKAK